MNWPEVVIFDCDGVLVDSEVISLGRTRSALGKAGLPLSEQEVFDRFLGVSVDSMLETVGRELGATLPDTFRRQLADDILADLEHELKGIEGLREALDGLGARVCVASSSTPDRIRRSLAVVGYSALFEPNIFSTTETARGKPHPDIFLYAAEKMRTAPGACLVIEDSVAGVIGAAKAGMRIFGFTGGSHITGPAQGERLLRAGASLVFDQMATLPKLIAGFHAQTATG
jgi:HAD superfamily hydrolase (TIGR01509 family)